jgi:hypothetical protein
MTSTLDRDVPLWHETEKWSVVTVSLRRLFSERGSELADIVGHAHTLKALMEEVSPFIQQITAIVCPGCERVCCVNRHGYYDRLDLIYVYALGLSHPGYRDGLEDAAPCQFLSACGCTLERPLRPFRCNWYFCIALIEYMETGPAKPYRKFVNRFQEIIEARRRMLEAFEETTRRILCQEKEFLSL